MLPHARLLDVLGLGADTPGVLQPLLGGRGGALLDGNVRTVVPLPALSARPFSSRCAKAEQQRQQRIALYVWRRFVLCFFTVCGTCDNQQPPPTRPAGLGSCRAPTSHGDRSPHPMPTTCRSLSGREYPRCLMLRVRCSPSTWFGIPPTLRVPKSRSFSDSTTVASTTETFRRFDTERPLSERPPEAAATPLSINMNEAETTAVVVLVDSNLAGDPAWIRYLHACGAAESR